MKFTKLRYSKIIGYIDAQNQVYSKVFEFGAFNMPTHEDLWGSIAYKRWEWTFSDSITCCSIYRDRFNKEDWDNIRLHLRLTYGIRFYDNGHHDIEYFILKMEKEEMQNKMNKQQEAEKLLTELAIEYVEENWDKFDVERLDLSTKQNLLDDIIEDFQIVMWIITEVSSWGFENWLEQESIIQELKVAYGEEDNTFFYIIDVNGKYIKVKLVDHNWEAKIVEKKTKMVEVEYFE